MHRRWREKLLLDMQGVRSAHGRSRCYSSDWHVIAVPPRGLAWAMQLPVTHSVDEAHSCTGPTGVAGQASVLGWHPVPMVVDDTTTQHRSPGAQSPPLKHWVVPAVNPELLPEAPEEPAPDPPPEELEAPDDDDEVPPSSGVCAVGSVPTQEAAPNETPRAKDSATAVRDRGGFVVEATFRMGSESSR
jgi:hypothetical protein